MVESEQMRNRRSILVTTLRGVGVAALGVLGLGVAKKVASAEGSHDAPPTGDKNATVWQIDPEKCIQCGNCAINCVLTPSAVKCIHHYAMCGYCKLCTGFFEPQPNALNTGAENQLCPVGAIEREFIEDPYYEYHINEDLCIGCGKCVAGCEQFGNGSLYLQIKHDLCKNCNECAIAVACPAEAIRKIPAEDPYLLKLKPAGEESETHAE